MIVRLNFKGLFGVDNYQIGPAYETSADVNGSNVDDVIIDILAIWGPILAGMAGIQVPPWIWTLLEVLRIDELDGSETFVGSSSLSIPGVRGGTPMPAFNAAMMGLRVLDNPRTAKLFVPAVSEDDSNGQVFNVAYTTILSALASSWTVPIPDVIGGVAMTPGMWSPTLLEFFVNVGESFIKTAVTHQIRRKVGVGV